MGDGPIVSISILDREEHPFEAASRDSLVVDLHCSDGTNSFIVEVHRYAQPMWGRLKATPFQTLYSPFEPMILDSDSESYVVRSKEEERCNQQRFPRHMLNFVDFESRQPEDADNSKIFPNYGALMLDWRSDNASTVAHSERVVQVYRLQPDRAAALRVDPLAEPNPTLDHLMRDELSVTYLHLPHAKQLHELSDESSGLELWASLFAHAHPDMLSALPARVRHLPGVKDLTKALLKPSTRKELSDSERAYRRTKAPSRVAMDDQEQRAESRGVAQGVVLGIAKLLRLQGISSVDAFEAKYGEAPDADTLAALHLLSKPVSEAS